MSIIELLKIEFMKVKRSMILPLLLIPPILVVVSGVFSISMYMTPEYTNAWSAMFIQSALLFGYYLLPFSMVVVCVMILYNYLPFPPPAQPGKSLANRI